jgi:hypothetical protein
LRIRIALSLGALVLAGGALTGGIAVASEAQPSAPSATTRPTEPPSAAPAPATSRQPTKAPNAVPAPPREATKAPGTAPRVPRAVPAGPTGDLHLPAIGVTR